MSGVEDERLSFRQVRQVLHDEVVLEPVREDRTVATVGHELVWELGDGRIQVVHNHELHRSSLLNLGRIVDNVVSLHRVVRRSESVAVNVSKLLQLLRKLWRQKLVVLSWNIA